MKPSVLIAVGCSWVAGAFMDCDPDKTEFDYNHTVDPEFRRKYSFAGLLQQQLGLNDVHFIAQDGASNDNQLRQLMSFIDTNRDNYSRVFVLWGLSSIYRWEAYSNTLNAVEDNTYGRVNHKPGVEEEIKYYFSHFWNREYELEKLGNKILLLAGYLKSQDIEYLFVNSFQGYSTEDFGIKNIDQKNFYLPNDNENDLASLLCKKNNIYIKQSKMPFLNLLRPAEKQMNSSHIRELQQLGWLDRATAHPTVKAHQLIANELYNYIKENNNERI
jgi:hypothetical protein